MVTGQGFEMAFEPFDYRRAWPADHQVQQRDDAEDRDVTEVRRGKHLPLEHELTDGENRKQRRVLEQSDKRVANWGDDDADGLRQDDEPHHLSTGHANGECGFCLTAVDG